MNKDDAQAQQHPSGMAVLSVLFELTTEKNKANKQVDSVIRALNKVITPSQYIYKDLFRNQIIFKVSNYFRNRIICERGKNN